MPTIASQRCPELFGPARVARLASLDAVFAVPHLVPVVFALDRDRIHIAVDGKPKRTTALRRLANVAAHPAVSLLVDHYDDADWDALWWVRADGLGRVVEPGGPEAAESVELLKAKYPQHRLDPPAGPVLRVDVERWSGWSAASRLPDQD